MIQVNLFWFLIFLFVAHFGFSQTPPGGITTDLEIWYDASDIDGDNDETNNPADGTVVSTWVDKSGNGNDATIKTGKNGAVMETDALELINGRPVLKFNRINQSNGSMYDTGLDIRAGTMEDMTIFLVYKPKTASVGVQQSPWGVDNGNWDRFYYSSFPHSLTGNNSETGIVSLGSSSPSFQNIAEASKVDEVYLQTTAYNGAVSGSTNSGPTNGSAVYFNGDVVTTFTDTTHPTNAFNSLSIGWDGDNGAYDGQIAEILVYSRILTACELEQINLALGYKYGRDFSGFIGSYDGAGTYFNNINAIGISGSACTGNLQIDETFSGGLTINNPSSNNVLNEFLIFAHNDTFEDALSSNTPPGTTIRQERAWRVEEETNTNINGPSIELGTVDLIFDLSALGFNGTGTDQFLLLIDDEGTDFSDATITATGVYSAGKVTFSSIDLEHEDYFTLAVLDSIQPTVTVEQSSSQSDPSFLNEGNILFTITFSEPIDPASFSCSDITISGTAAATCTGITEITPFDITTFEVALSATTIGTVIADILAATVQDISGNDNAVSTSVDNSVTIVPRKVVTNRRITYRVTKN